MTLQDIRAKARGVAHPQQHSSAPGLTPREANLGARFTPGSGDTLLTGVQAIAKLLVEQHANDQRQGRNTANFITGYQGSPLAGVDKLLHTMPGVLSASHTTFQPGLNEELAATALWGSQVDLPTGQSRYDGVVGYWYGKGPGLDRAVDALRHANMFGVNPRGGAVLFVGDDPASKSSTVPAVSERTIASLHIPVLFPRNSAEVVTHGLHAVNISRLTGCVVALKITTDVAEGASIVRDEDCVVEADTPEILVKGKPWQYTQRGVSLAPGHIQAAEIDLFGPRTEGILQYARAHQLNPIEIHPPHATTGIIASGTTYSAIRQAWNDMGITDDDLFRAGIRCMKLGLMHPIDREGVREFAEGLTEILVVEEKTSFIETAVRDGLYATNNPPAILGKRGREDEPLIPHDGELTADRLARPLAKVFAAQLPHAVPTPTRIPLPLLSTSRKPYFCSGCPHNRSTVLPEGSIGGGGIGCHTMVSVEARETSNVTGITQMGGEGAQWIGQAPFTDVPHIFQNVGDGTFFHSGQLAVQACVAAGVNITYKILFNDVVAMTGAQDAEGALTVAMLTHKLSSEGVQHIIVCSEDPSQHRKSDLARGTLLWHRDRLEEAQLKLRDTRGVTAIIYEQHCAADARRQRKRGTMPVRSKRVVINEAVCEGCGDCGMKSNCLSVQPVDTEFGRKTRIDQTSCNTDYTCLTGDCPSFITVESDPSRATLTDGGPEAPELPAPTSVPTKDHHGVFIAGIGGTGILTVNQVLATAAFITGYDVHTLDQTGLSQKAGPVTSHLRLSRGAQDLSNRVSGASADCVLAFDLMTATVPVNLAYLDPEITTTVASTSATPTGDMVYDPGIAYPSQETLLSRIAPLSRDIVTFDALRAAHTLFGTTEHANFLVVGAACQSGSLALSPEAIEEAITLNGVAVDANIQSFRWGRAAVAYPEVFAEATVSEQPEHEKFHDCDLSGLPDTTAEVVQIRASSLVDYHGRAVSDAYLEKVRDIAAKERDWGDNTEFSETVARYLYKLTAYKDEYEVARLLTQTGDTARALSDVPGAHRVTFQLHPPFLRAVGRKAKIGFGGGSRWTLSLMAHGKFLRGTPLDVFGYARVRRIERALVIHYRELVSRLVDTLGADRARAIRIATLPDLIRGYEGVKLGNVHRYCDELEAQGEDASTIRALLGSKL